MPFLKNVHTGIVWEVTEAQIESLKWSHDYEVVESLTGSEDGKPAAEGGGAPSETTSTSNSQTTTSKTGSSPAAGTTPAK